MAKETRSRGATPRKPAMSWRQRAGTAVAQRREQHRATLAAIAIAGLVGATSASIWYVQTFAGELAEHFPIQRIAISGDIKYIDRKALEAALRPYMEENFFSLNLDEVRQSTESMVWIDYASARKEWPNTLVVSLQERIPVANWGKNQFLSAKGEIFFAEHVQPNANLPTFIGMADQAELIARHYVQMQAVLKNAGLTINALEMTDRVSMTLKLNGDMSLVVDEKESLEKLQRFTAVYQLFTDEQRLKLSHVDLRYENGLAIKWKKGNGDTNAA